LQRITHKDRVEVLKRTGDDNTGFDSQACSAHAIVLDREAWRHEALVLANGKAEIDAVKVSVEHC
jgi:hypothetical protein